MLFSFALSSFLLAISPGPDNLYLTAITSKSGKLYGIAFLIGLLIGCLIHTILLSIGLNTLIIQHEIIFEFVKYIGVSYILFLSYSIYISKNDLDKFGEVEVSDKIFKIFKRGILMNLLNPKVFLFFALFFPNFLFSKTLPFMFQILILGKIFIIITFMVFSIIIVFSDFIYRNFSKNNNYKNFIKYFNISVLLLIAFLIFFTENNITLT